jgi:VIT1/CCC1 family predicted Fe2+/Mn2+ transporter/rubrerythrin
MAIDPHPTEDQNKSQTIRLLQQNWVAEAQGARNYRELAASEKSAKRREILLRMADAEERHAAGWERKLRELGAAPPVMKDSWLGRLRRRLIRSGGVDRAIHQMEATEDRDIARYTAHQEQLSHADEQVGKMLHDFELEERSHARALRAMSGLPVASPRTALDAILSREKWHGRGGGWVSDAIYGVNDGLGAVFGIVSGVAGATDNQRHYVLLAGLAGMIASALSMGAGAYLAVKSEREVHEAEISREKQEIQENPQEEEEEMALFYQLQGFSEEESRQMARKLAQDPGQMIRVMAQSELGLSEEHFRNPWVSAASAMLSTGVGAFIPIIPFFFLGGLTAVILAFGISLAAHFAVGAAKSLITNRSWWASGLEMTGVGVLEAVVTYGLGRAFGALT